MDKQKISIVARALVIGMVAALVLAGTAMGEVTRTGLVAEYHFDGDAKDSSGNGNDGTIYGATFVDGISGKALSFNGVSDYVQTSVSSSTTYTLEAWVKPNAMTGGIIGNDDGAYRGKSWFFSSDGRLSIHNCHPNTCNDIYSTAAISTGVWSHFVVSVSAGTATFYKNGVASGGGSPVEQYGLSWWIGKGWSSSGYFNGIIDEIRIYNRALSTEEIKANYEVSITPPSPKLILTKSLSPSAISEGDSTTITIKVENTGLDAKSIKIKDTIPKDFNLISGAASQEYSTLKAGEARTFQYIIKSAGTGRYVTDAATATYSDDKGNSYTSASNTVAISVLAQGAPLPKDSSQQEDKTIPYLLLGLGGGVIILLAALLLKSRSKHQASSPQAPAGVQTFDAERQRQHQILPPEKLDSDTRSYLGLGINTALSNLGAEITKAESDIRIAKDELKKTEDVLSKLEARLANKEITEQTYKNLETKYKTKVTELQNKVAGLESEAAKLKKIYSFIQEKGKYYT